MDVERFIDLRKLQREPFAEPGDLKNGLGEALDALEQAENDISAPVQMILNTREWAVRALIGVIIDAGKDIAGIRDADSREDRMHLAHVAVSELADKLQAFTSEYGERNAAANRAAEEHRMRVLLRALEVLR